MVAWWWIPISWFLITWAILGIAAMCLVFVGLHDRYKYHKRKSFDEKTFQQVINNISEGK